MPEVAIGLPAYSNPRFLEAALDGLSERKGPRPKMPTRTGLLKSRHSAGFAAAAEGTPYAAMTRSSLPWRFVLDRADKIGNGVRRSLFARTHA